MLDRSCVAAISLNILTVARYSVCPNEYQTATRATVTVVVVVAMTATAAAAEVSAICQYWQGFRAFARKLTRAIKEVGFVILAAVAAYGGAAAAAAAAIVVVAAAACIRLRASSAFHTRQPNGYSFAFCCAVPIGGAITEVVGIGQRGAIAG